MSDSSHVYSFTPIIFVGRAGRASVASMLQTFWLEVLLKYLPLLHLMLAHQTHQTQNPSAVPNSSVYQSSDLISLHAFILKLMIVLYPSTKFKKMLSGNQAWQWSFSHLYMDFPAINLHLVCKRTNSSKQKSKKIQTIQTCSKHIINKTNSLIRTNLKTLF